MFYINENIHCKTVNVKGPPNDCAVTLIELYIESQKLLCGALQKSLLQMKSTFLKNTSVALPKMSFGYENVVLIGYINLTVENKNLQVFMNTSDLECLVKKPTCFQSTKWH